MLESFSFKETLTCFMVLFAVIDILGSFLLLFLLESNSGILMQKEHRLFLEH